MPEDRAKRAIRRFELAHEAYVNRGGGDPDDIEFKVLNYKIAKAKLVKFIVGNAT